MCARRRTGQLDIDEEIFIFIATTLTIVAGTALLTIPVVYLGSGDVIRAPAVGVFDYSESVCAHGFAVVGTLAVGLPFPEDYKD